MAALRSFKRISGLLQLLLLLLLLPRDLVVTGQNIDVIQLLETVSVKAGENLTLKCTLTGGNIPGSVRWYKGPDRSQTPIYSDKQEASNRGVRVIPGSNTDFSIDIQNVRPEDAGTYYCVKFRVGNPEKELVSGKGTLVSVIGQNIDVTQLPETVSVKAGENLTLKCTLTGGNIPGGVRWYKGPDRSQTPIFSDKQKISNRGARVIPGSNTDFSIDIQNVHPEDAGTYYCVKFRAGNPEKELVSGKGTLVSVIGSSPQLSPSVLYIGLFLSKVAVILFISSFFLIRKIKCKSQN